MIELCRKKKIDLILTKSISRFARNTLDCIKHVRILKSWGIPVIFEKRKQGKLNSEKRVGPQPASFLPQAESKSISGNVTKGHPHGLPAGPVQFPI